VVGFVRVRAGSLGGDSLLADGALRVLLAMAILVAVPGLGNVVVVALLLGPAASARLIARQMAPMMALAAILAVAGGAGGLYLSYCAGTAAGASIAAMMVAVYIALAAWRVIGRGPGRRGLETGAQATRGSDSDAGGRHALNAHGANGSAAGLAPSS